MSCLHPVPENHPVHSLTTVPPTLISTQGSADPWEVFELDLENWNSLAMLCPSQNHDICNCPHCSGRKRWGGRVTLTYQLIFLPWVPKLLWKSSGRCDLQAAVMDGCKNGWAYAQSPAEQREVLGTIFCPLCYCKFHWFEYVWSMIEQIKFQSLQLRKLIMNILWRKNTKKSQTTRKLIFIDYSSKCKSLRST